MNFTLIIVMVIIILAAVHGYKKGLTREVSGLISWAVTLFVMSLVIMLYTSLSTKETKNSIFTIVLFLAVASVYGVVRIFLKSAKILSGLPLFKTVDKFLGIGVGAAEGLLLVWLMYILNESGLLGQFGEMIRTDTAGSEILSAIYQYNYLVKIAKGF